MNKSYAIIGLGFCGIVSLHRLVSQFDKSKRHSLTLNIFAPEGINVPSHYNDSNDEFILNVPVSNMSAFPEDKDHFYRWLVKNNYYFNKKFNKDSFVPRKLYGQYLMDILRDAINKANNKGLGLNFHFNRVEDIEKIDIGFMCKTDSGQSIFSDKVFVAIGPSYIEMQNTIDHSRAFSMIKQSPSKYEKIAIIGSSLSAVDVIAGLKANNYKGEMHVFSKSKTFPSLRVDTESTEGIDTSIKAGDSLRMCLKKVSKFLSKNKQYNIVHVIASIRSVTKDIWSHFDDYDKSVFKRKILRHWNKNRHCIPPETHKLVSSVFKSKGNKIHGHSVNSVSKNGKKITINAGNKKFEKFDIAINCMGFDLSFKNSILLNNMSRNGVAKYDIFGAKSLDNDIVFFGSLNTGRYLESTSVYELSVQVMDAFKDVNDVILKRAI